MRISLNFAVRLDLQQKATYIYIYICVCVCVCVCACMRAREPGLCNGNGKFLRGLTSVKCKVVSFWDLRHFGIMRSVEWFGTRVTQSKSAWSLKMGPIACPETSVRYTIRRCVKFQKRGYLMGTAAEARITHISFWIEWLGAFVLAGMGWIRNRRWSSKCYVEVCIVGSLKDKRKHASLVLWTGR